MKTILLIEDNDDIRENTAEILQLASYAVLTAENGMAGVQLALHHLPDLIICDIMMPVLDGYGVLHAIQRNEEVKNTPFIFLTAKTERADFRKGMEMGADDYISKPFDGTELLNAVHQRLKKREVLDAGISAGLKGINELKQLSSPRQILQPLAENRDADKYRKKQLVYAEGNYPQRLYLVVSGSVKTFKTNNDGKDLVTETYFPGDFFGVTALLESLPYKETAETMDDTELIAIPKEDFDELVNNDPAITKAFMRLLARNIDEKEKKLLSLAYNSLRKKVAETLVEVYTKNKGTESSGINISRENLAAIAGTATESLIRTLSDFKQEKLIEIEQGKIVVLNLKGLETLKN